MTTRELLPNHLEVGDDLGDAFVSGKPRFITNRWWETFKTATIQVPIVYKKGLQPDGIRSFKATDKVTADVMEPV